MKCCTVGGRSLKVVRHSLPLPSPHFPSLLSPPYSSLLSLPLEVDSLKSSQMVWWSTVSFPNAQIEFGAFDIWWQQLQ